MPTVVSLGLSDVGRSRKHNEDFFLTQPDLGLYVVCDGMGGHAAGEVASKLTAETVRDVMSAEPEVASASTAQLSEMMKRAVEEANRRVHQLGVDDPNRKGMGTTCTAVVLRGGKAVMAHVGDSRLYLVRNGALHLLSEDHTFVAEAVRKGVLTPEQAATSAHSNVVTRAVGPHAKVLVDTLVFDILPGDLLLLCSDGLHQYFELTPHELLGHIDVDSIDGLPEKLIRIANEEGGSDNITALVVQVLSETPPQEAEQKRVSKVTNTFSTLRHVQLLSELSHAELTKVCEYFDTHEHGPGDTIVAQGDISEGLFVTVSGEVEIVRGDKVLSVLPAGSHFGEMALLNQRPRTATARAKTPCSVLYLSRERFYSVVQQNHIVGIKVLWKLAQTLSTRLEEIYEAPPESKEKRTTQTMGLYPPPFAPPRT